MKKIAIVYIAHDGFTSLYTGVGTVARDFLLSFPSVYEELKNDIKSTQLSLFATTIKYNNNCFGYSDEVKNVSEQYTKKYKNIHLVELINGSAGTKSYGSIDIWKNACISAATFVYTLANANQFDKIIAICVDTPFAQVSNYFFDQYTYKKVKFVWLPQSTVLIHKIDSALGKSFEQNSYLKERFNWEKAVIDLAKENSQVKIGCVGEFMRAHLTKDYGANDNILINLHNGLFFERLKKNVISQEKISSLLKSLGVPIDRPLLFSFGRAEPYKGLDLVLRNSADLITKKNYFVLIFASPYSVDDPYVSELNNLAEKYPNAIKIIYGLDFLTPHYIMQWHNTKILALFSRAEPFGLIPTEARFYRNKNLSITTSELGGYREQIKNGVDGYMTGLDDKSIRSSLIKIADLNAEQKAIMTNNGYTRILNEYNQIKINVDFLKQLINS